MNVNDKRLQKKPREERLLIRPTYAAVANIKRQ